MNYCFMPSLLSLFCHLFYFILAFNHNSKLFFVLLNLQRLRQNFLHMHDCVSETIVVYFSVVDVEDKELCMFSLLAWFNLKGFSSGKRGVLAITAETADIEFDSVTVDRSTIH